MKKEFDVKMNMATIIFLVAYAAYVLLSVILGQEKMTLMMVIIFGVLIYTFFLGFRPYKYSIDKKTLTVKYRLWKNTEIDLMECETICDPVSRWADIATRPHAIEVYTNVNKRYCFFPKRRIDFVTHVLQGNKRIHCTVKEYTDAHRQIEKKLRKERRKALKRDTEKESD